MSCTSRGKPIRSLEDGFEAVVDGLDRSAEILEQAIDDATRGPEPAQSHCRMGEKERKAANALFWQLTRAQNGGVQAAVPEVHEDAAMAHLMQRLKLIDGSEPRSQRYLQQLAQESEETSTPMSMRELVGQPPCESMLRHLHAFPVGHWLRADPRRRGYTVDDWEMLLQMLLAPQPLVECLTIPQENPLPISALLQIPSKGILVCGCANDSYLDKAEHMIDGPANTVAASCSRPHSSPGLSAGPLSYSYSQTSSHPGSGAFAAATLDSTGAIRPLGALLVWRWPASATEESADAAMLARAAHRAGHGGHVIDGMGLLQAFTPLTSGVGALAYCAGRNLVVVGSQTGSIHLYSVGSRGALNYRYAIEAHGAAILALSLRPHPMRASAIAQEAEKQRAEAAAAEAAAAEEELAAMDAAAAARAEEDVVAREAAAAASARAAAMAAHWKHLEGGSSSSSAATTPGRTAAAHATTSSAASSAAADGAAAATSLPSSPPSSAATASAKASAKAAKPILGMDDLLISSAEVGYNDLHEISSSLFAYDLGRQMAMPLTAPLDEAVRCVLSEEMHPTSPHYTTSGPRLFLGTVGGSVLITSLMLERSHRRAANGKPLPEDHRRGPYPPGGTARSGARDDDDDHEEDPISLELRQMQRKSGGHNGYPVTALAHCAARNVLVSGAADGTVCVWALSTREVRSSATRLLGRLSGPVFMGEIVSLSVLVPPSGGAPRVVGAGSEGFVYDWDLSGGRVCRAIQKIPHGTAGLAVDSRPHGGSCWLAQGMGVLQLWRWPPSVGWEEGIEAGTDADFGEANSVLSAIAPDDSSGGLSGGGTAEDARVAALQQQVEALTALVKQGGTPAPTDFPGGAPPAAGAAFGGGAASEVETMTMEQLKALRAQMMAGPAKASTKKKPRQLKK